MSIYLDLGDGRNALAPEDEITEETQTFMDSVARQALEVWGPGDTTAGQPAMPANTVAWVTYDPSPMNPRHGDSHLCVLYGRDTASLAESSVFAGIVDRFSDRRDPVRFIEPAAANQLGAVAVDCWQVGDRYAPVWGYITHESVMETVAPPTTPEEVAAYLDLDVRARGLEVLKQEFREYDAWANGCVYIVRAEHVPTSASTALGGIYDSHPFAYAREVATDLAKEVAP